MNICTLDDRKRTLLGEKLKRTSRFHASLQLTVGILFLTIACQVFAAESYREPFRPQFHFTPERNWMNDPNGMVFFDGEYHLFFQHNPFGDKWGHMSWGHAVSRDLVHWEHLPVALAEENGVMIFSGSAVVDWKNTSGFGNDSRPPLVAIYTGHYTTKPLQNQHIAYSTDRGRTWTKFSGNPVLDIGERDFRDPKVFWHEPTRRWVMVVAWPVQRKVRFYGSPNLKEWTHLSDFGPAGSTKGIWECPDLFPIRVEGQWRVSKWALIVNVGSGAPAGGSGCQYFVGDFDGASFTLDAASHPRGTPEFVPQGTVVADFERDDYPSWRASGEAFGSQPARGQFQGQQAVSGFRGRGLVNSFKGGDGPQGTLTSGEFTLSHSYLSFLIGGGNHAGKTCLNLLVDGRAVRTATGDNAEQLNWKSWDVREFRGKNAALEIVDQHSGGWGHINVDHILLADQPARPATEAALWADFGRDFYAAVSWSDIPKRDGRRLWLGWMSNWEYAQDVPTSPWRSAMTVPRELELRTTPQGLRLVQEPVGELRTLRGKNRRLRNASGVAANAWLSKQVWNNPLHEIEAEFAPVESAGQFGLKLITGSAEEMVVGCDAAQGRLYVDRTRSGRTNFHSKFAAVHEAPLRLPNGRVRLRLFLDTSSLEVFANDGESVVTDLILPNASERRIELFSSGELPKVKTLEVWELRSVWR
ncbi:MAG: glycoside hydrolase family 32 protein [Verrucomicrobia bacterium]|nr:glycoside hydrolase family 32 protein [Verrucomicrobiota bacterium]